MGLVIWDGLTQTLFTSWQQLPCPGCSSTSFSSGEADGSGHIVTGLNWERDLSFSRFIREIKISATQLHFKVPGQASRLRWTGLGPRGTGSMFFIWSSIWATLLFLFSIRRRSEKSASRERERGQNTRSARMKGGAQKHWRQNGFHSHSGGRPEVPYLFLARLFAIISGTLSSLRHGIWLRGTLSNTKSCSHALHECL